MRDGEDFVVYGQADTGTPSESTEIAPDLASKSDQSRSDVEHLVLAVNSTCWKAGSYTISDVPSWQDAYDAWCMERWQFQDCVTVTPASDYTSESATVFKAAWEARGKDGS